MRIVGLLLIVEIRHLDEVDGHARVPARDKATEDDVSPGPRSWSTRPATLASMSTEVVSWTDDALEMKLSVEIEVLVTLALIELVSSSHYASTSTYAPCASAALCKSTRRNAVFTSIEFPAGRNSVRSGAVPA
jgi:hypothetical protein